MEGGARWGRWEADLMRRAGSKLLEGWGLEVEGCG